MGVTNFNPDVQDLYAEQFDGQGKRYRVGNEWHNAELRTEAEKPSLDVASSRGAPTTCSV